jgi:hypothetical protein
MPIIQVDTKGPKSKELDFALFLVKTKAWFRVRLLRRPSVRGYFEIFFNSHSLIYIRSKSLIKNELRRYFIS